MEELACAVGLMYSRKYSREEKNIKVGVHPNYNYYYYLIMLCSPISFLQKNSK